MVREGDEIIEKQGQEHATLLVLKIEDGITSRRIKTNSISWTRAGVGFFPKPSGKEQHNFTNTLIFIQGNLCQTQIYRTAK